jgi:hypothetical protein
LRILLRRLEAGNFTAIEAGSENCLRYARKIRKTFLSSVEENRRGFYMRK